jgi:hypothetical protein
VYEDVKEVIHRGIVRGRRSLEDVQHVECKIFIEGVITTVKGIYFSCDGGMALRGSQGTGGPKGCVGKGASLDYNEGMTKLACLQRMVL